MDKRKDRGADGGMDKGKLNTEDLISLDTLSDLVDF